MAVAVRLDRTQFGDARIADPAVLDRPARTAISITIRDRARADDGAGGERPCHSGVRKQPAEIEGHVDACVWFAERLAIDERQQRQMNLAAVPGGTEFIGRDRARRERRDRASNTLNSSP